MSTGCPIIAHRLIAPSLFSVTKLGKGQVKFFVSFVTFPGGAFVKILIGMLVSFFWV